MILTTHKDQVNELMKVYIRYYIYIFLCLKKRIILNKNCFYVYIVSNY